MTNSYTHSPGFCPLLVQEFVDTLEFYKKNIAPELCLPFNAEIHKTDLKYLKNLVDCIEAIMNCKEKCLIETFNIPKDLMKAHELYEKRYKTVHKSLIFTTQQTVQFENDKCAICHEEQSKKPMYCLQCLKVVGCYDCIVDWVGNEESQFLKCLRCQRRCLSSCPTFYFAKM
uniref:RING-type domain-containing protein n=1 Tax=Bursaphelenchus xylophilus TaxID=6326 RepID=A0A1I7SFD8_BURXY